MDRLTALYQQFDPLQPLPAGENALYIDWQHELMPYDDVKLRLVNAVARSGGAPMARLLTGHRGTGKTTELYRVQQMLMDGKKSHKVFVSFLECEQLLDLNDVSPQDLVLQMVRQLVHDLKAAGYGVGYDKFNGFFREIGEILKSDVEFKDLKLKADPIELGVAIKQIPGARAGLRKLLEDRLPRIYDLVNNEILGPARKFLYDQGYNDILIIVDQLDRIPQKQVNQITNHEDLFLNSAGILRALACDILYTIPIELAYSHCHGRLSDIYGGEILTLPMIDVSQESGLAVLQRMVAARATAAGVTVEEGFSPGQLERLCRLSGGHPRSLFMLIRAALDRTSTLPLDQPLLDRAIRLQASDFGKSLSPEQWQALKQVHENHEPLNDDPKQWMTFLRERYVYAYYSDGNLWYDWNPLLGEVKR
ncbi:MAG: hypothetical protein K2X03_22890 [Bryobacteraceae bacterium]|nr:hypothetical protein [Bryobacteraceae bacterium]